jgi:hypothetical protein
LLTENTADYIVLDAEYRGRHLAHWGLIFTSNRTFPKAKKTDHGQRQDQREETEMIQRRYLANPWRATVELDTSSLADAAGGEG